MFSYWHLWINRFYYATHRAQSQKCQTLGVPNKMMAEAFSILAHATRLLADKYRAPGRSRSYVTVAKLRRVELGP